MVIFTNVVYTVWMVKIKRGFGARSSCVLSVADVLDGAEGASDPFLTQTLELSRGPSAGYALSSPLVCFSFFGSFHHCIYMSISSFRPIERLQSRSVDYSL